MFPEGKYLLARPAEFIPGDYCSGIMTFTKVQHSLYTIGNKFQTEDRFPDRKQMQETTWLLISAYELLLLAADVVFWAAEVEK